MVFVSRRHWESIHIRGLRSIDNVLVHFYYMRQKLLWSDYLRLCLTEVLIHYGTDSIMLSFTEPKVNLPKKSPFVLLLRNTVGCQILAVWLTTIVIKCLYFCNCSYSVLSNLFIRQRDTYRLKYYFLKKYPLFILK